MDNYWNSENCQCPDKMDSGRYLQDFRTPSRRELYNMYINGIKRDDDMRKFYQNNAVDIMNKEWEFLRTTKSCFTNACIHNNPTRSTPGMDNLEMQMYNAVRSNQLKKNHPNFPHCKPLEDYRMTMD